ncbi:hypothetical protein GCM10022198_07940 [Klugiella xanthotipulae]|uniref:DUF6993 domain-containing protein n=1 Tax=Klugiella xanthotipulae TaxID=244735 RepID=A0A543HSY1_9MICO|nr:hypothetical protein [Klugiella xanthotipulae]TQM61446.1 hypothetical protein FB466_2400 [Klugiella xanthotipulae]
MKKRRIYSGIAVLVIVGVVSGCSLIDMVTGRPAPAARSTTAPTSAAPEEVPEFVPDGTAEQNLPFFSYTNQATASGGADINGENVVNALVAAGFDKSAMQVSFDKTQTNLVADNIFVSVLVGQECLLGQFVTGDRSVTGLKVAAVGPDKSVCIIGETRPIDW